LGVYSRAECELPGSSEPHHSPNDVPFPPSTRQVIAQTSEDEGWEIKFARVIGIWRAGCIIQSNAIADIFEPIFQENPKLTHLLESQKVADELSKCFNALKRVCMVGIESDSTIPSLDATLG
jgi:6-phosphogluconate dehydrogenase